MKTETFGFTIETAYGRNLPAPLTVSAEFDAFETYEEIPANELPSNKEIVNFLNAKAKASARASETTKSLTAAAKKWAEDNPGGKENPYEKPTLESSEELRFNTIVKALMAGGVAEDVAKQQASGLTGYTPSK